MKTTILHFKNENDYLDWESKKGNTIFALQDMQGRYIGDIKGSDMDTFMKEDRIVSLDNPSEKQLHFIMKNITELGEANYSITNDNDKAIFEKLVIIQIEKPKVVLIPLSKIKAIAKDIISDKEWVNDSHSSSEHKGIKAGLNSLINHIEETNKN